jgi:hypothetical protein
MPPPTHLKSIGRVPSYRREKAMKPKIAAGFSILLSGMLLAQQPVPMGKVDNSSRNYRSADGTVLSSKSSDEDLSRALYEDYANDPTFSGVQVSVKHHGVKLAGSVASKETKKRAEYIASHTAGVRYVQNALKVNDRERPEATTLDSTAH